MDYLGKSKKIEELFWSIEDERAKLDQKKFEYYARLYALKSGRKKPTHEDHIKAHKRIVREQKKYRKEKLTLPTFLIGIALFQLSSTSFLLGFLPFPYNILYPLLLSILPLVVIFVIALKA